MMNPRSILRFFAFIIFIALTVMACQTSSLFPDSVSESTQTLYPTYTPYPTYTFFPTLPLDPTPAEMLFEDFEANETCFAPYSDAIMTAEVANGTFAVEINQSNQSFWAVCQNQVFTDFSLYVDIQTLEDSPGAFYSGVIFRESGGQYYSFFLSTTLDGYPVYCLSYNSPTIYIPLSNSSFDPGNCWAEVPLGVFDDDHNTLRVSTTGGIIKIFLNDEILFLTRDNILSAGRVGLIAGTYDQAEVTVAFDNFRVTQP